MLDLVTTGEAFDDFVFYNLAALPAAGRELKTDAFVQTAGGGAVITAIAAARLGARVQIVSGLSREGARRLRAERVAVMNVRRAGEPPAVTVAISTRRDRRYLTFNGMNVRLPARILPQLQRLRARHVHFALHPGRCRLWVRALQRLRGGGATTSWDFGWNPDLLRDRDFDRLVAGLDYLFLNRDEALLYAKRSRLDRAIERWRRLRGLAVIKLGRQGSRAVGRGGIDVCTAAPRVRVVDTTGAGDAFDGAFLVARLRGLSLTEALQFANGVAAASTLRAGGIDGLPS